MKYYILNINYGGKSEVDYWLGERGLAPVFYGQSTLSQIKDNIDHRIPPQAYVDAKLFVNTFINMNSDAVVFSIGNEDVYIFKQEGPLFEDKSNGQKHSDIVKCFKIDLIKKIKIKYCPLVLVSIKANTFIQRGTFRDLNSDKYLGNTKALEYVITGKLVKVPNYAIYLQCLSSLEFETLVAKYLEEDGLFVPAYKGGFLRNYDLFCRNTQNSDVVINDTVVKPGGAISVQVKLHFDKDHKDILDRVDLFFCISSTLKDNKICDWGYLKDHILANGSTRKWLETNLDWVQIAPSTN